MIELQQKMNKSYNLSCISRNDLSASLIVLNDVLAKLVATFLQVAQLEVKCCLDLNASNGSHQVAT